MNVNKCAVRDCKKYAYHRLPKDEIRRALWIKAIQNGNRSIKISQFSKICSAHFQVADFSLTPSYWHNYHTARRYLKRTAVPSLFPWNITCQEQRLSSTQVASLFLTQGQPSSSAQGQDPPVSTKLVKTYGRKNNADSPRNKTTIDMSKVQLFRDPQTKPSDNGKQPIHNSINLNLNPSKGMEHQNCTSEITNTEVVWLPTASQKGEKTLALENENIETLHSENESDEDHSSVSDQSDDENESLNSSGDTQRKNDLKNTIPNTYGKQYNARSNEQDLTQQSEKFNPSDRKRTFNPNDILQQLKVINSTEISKPGEYIFVSKREYCREWLKHQALSGFDQDQKLFNYLASKLKPSRALETREYLKSLVSSLSYQLSHMWTESGKNKVTFYKEYSDWLDGPTIKLAVSRPIDIQPTSSIPNKLVRNDIKTNADAFKFLKNLKPPFAADELIKTVPCSDLTPEQNAKLNDFCTIYSADIKFKWLTSNNDEGVFFKKFECWLKLNIKWPAFLKDVLPIPKKIYPETVENEELNIPSIFSEDVVMKMISNSKIDTIEQILASKCAETGKDISKILHRVIHHPEDAALIAGLMSDRRECSCYPQLAGKKIPDKDTVKKFKPPSQEQKEVLKMTIEILKDSMPTPKDPLDDHTTESPIHKKDVATVEAHQTMLNEILSRFKVTNLPVPNPILIKEEVNQDEIISTVNDPILIHDENDEIETNQANEGDDKIVERAAFKLKVISPTKINKRLKQPIDCLSVISTAEESLHNSNEEMTVDTPLNNHNTIDNDDNFETLTEQINENHREKLEFGPVLDKLIFIQPINVTNGTIIRLPKNKEAVVCKVSNCSATVLVPKFIKKNGPNVRVRKSNYKIKKLVKRATIDKKNTASSKTSTEKQISSNLNHGILQDSPKRSQESLVQMQTASRKVLVSGNTKRKEEIIANVKFKPPSQAQKQVLKMTVERLKELLPTPKNP